MQATTDRAARPVAHSDAGTPACVLTYQFSRCSIASGEFFLSPRERATGIAGRWSLTGGEFWVGTTPNVSGQRPGAGTE